ncbi:rhomboid family intramembrane serine protease [Halosimplex salinum]|uniref:rhomboid family intramembrane serine protease n=1 Tax=Halosimplex salinum TaxID=1710538 RepID=UPI000F498A7A|nr:rhomboid family intramembrane serine protease [Halosimplex salinum]
MSQSVPESLLRAVLERARTVAEVLPLQQLFLVVAVLLSLAVARSLTPTDRRWGDRLRRRFVLGVPWGTLLTMFGVVLVYWVVQGGWEHPNNPLVIPFRSWSYFYPLGTLVAGFAHNGVGHITGNLTGTLLFAPVVEYYVGHYPRERGSESFASPLTNPFVRVLAVPAGSLVAGVFTGLFSLGPVIGFSGVVYAYIGFAVVTRPLLAVLVLVSERVVDLLYRALRNPLITREPGPSFYSPWWADIAIQGHAIGILFGAVLGIALLARRNEYPDPLYLWFAALIFGIRQSLWAIYAPVGSNTYVLYRAVGVGLMFLFAALVANGVTASDRRLVPSLGRPTRGTGVRVLVVVLVVLSAVAVPFGLTTVSGDLPDDARTVEIRDYTVTYVEGAPDQYVSLVNDYLYDDARQIRSSGVVVFSERRSLWIQEVSKGNLAHRGRATVRVGGLGWRESVYANREGWSLVGNGSAYKVTLRAEGEQERLAYATERVRAEPVIDGRNVSIAPVEEGFEVVVTRNGSVLGRAPVPVKSNGTSVAGLTLERSGQDLFAVRDRTRVRVANKVVPRAQRD